MINFYTTHIDDSLAPAEALEEINFFVHSQQLNANTIGIVHCHADFVDEGLLQAICDVLPFDTVGCTTTAIADDEASLQYGLEITILSSDDVSFHTSVSPPASAGMDYAMGTLYETLITSLSETPKLIIPFIPFLVTNGGDEFISRLSALSNYSIPFFGTLSISNEADYSRCYTIHNGRAYVDSAVLLSLSGNVVPRFTTTTVASEELLPIKGAITEVDKNLLISIDNIPAEEFLAQNGLSLDSIGKLSSLNLIVDLPTGEHLIRNCIGGDGKGSVYLTGHIPSLGTIGFAMINADAVVNSSRQIAEVAASAADGNGMLMYSCIARNWVLVDDTLAELNAIRDTVDERSHFLCCYSGGEIYPQVLPNGNIAATLQNSSYTVCLL
jgi:hypothetical protein